MNQYFLRVRGKVMGPFSVEKMTALRDRGRLLPEHEVSRDRANWTIASQISQLFPQTVQELHEKVEPATAPAVAVTPRIEWYYRQDDVENGPIGFAELQRLSACGELMGDDLVWNENFPDWKTADSVNGLSSASSQRDGSNAQTAYQNARRVASHEFWDSILQFVRVRITAQDLESACQVLLRLGSYALMLAMLVGPGFLLIQAVKLDSIQLGLMSLGAFFGLAVLKYVAQRMSVAAHDVVSASPNRLSSTAFTDSIAVLLLFMAVGSAGLFTLWGIQQPDGAGTIMYIVMGGQLLISFGYIACTALHPEWLNIDCSNPVRAGEEGIGVISFFLKICLRFAPINFGIGAIVGAAGLTVAATLLLVGGEWLPTALIWGFYSLGWLLAVCLLPTVAYLLMVFWSIMLDLVQAVLIVPDKLDHLSVAAKRDTEERTL